jgi:hypothetical protein
VALLTQGDKIVSRQAGLLPFFKSAVIITLVPVNKTQPPVRPRIILIPGYSPLQRIFGLEYG